MKKITLIVFALCFLVLGMSFREKTIEREVIEDSKARVMDNINPVKVYQDKYNNDDIVGIVSINNLLENELIVQGNDNEYYLEHDLLGNYFSGGSLFVDYRINLDDTKKIIVYGHSSSRIDIPFSKLQQYLDKEFFYENPDITLTTKNGTDNYKIFSVMLLDNDYFYTRLSFDDKTWLEHLKEYQDKSLYKTDFTFNKDSKLLVLQTCSQQYKGKYVVIAAIG